MRSAIVVGLLLLAITSQHSGPEFVTHDCTRDQLSPFCYNLHTNSNPIPILNASSLPTCLRPSTFCSCRPRVSTPTSAIAVDSPRCSAAATRRHRAESRSLYVAVVMCGSAERAVGLSQGCTDPRCHCWRQAGHSAADRDVDSVWRSGRRQARRCAIRLQCRPPSPRSVNRAPRWRSRRHPPRLLQVDVGDYSEFESLALRVVGHRSASFVVVCVYRPPGTVTSHHARIPFF